MTKRFILIGLSYALLSAANAELSSEFRTEKVFLADSKKSTQMIKDGLIVGGDRAINQVIVKEIRHSINADFERIVIDLEGNLNGEPAGIPRAPYFQVDVSPMQRRVGFSIWGQPKLNFPLKRIANLTKNSKILKNIVLLPKVEDEVWTFELPLKSDATVEVFELSKPVRIIMDIKKKKS